MSEWYKMNKSDAIARVVSLYLWLKCLFYICPTLRDERKQSLCLLFVHEPKLPIHLVYSRAFITYNNKLRLFYHAVYKCTSQEQHLSEHSYLELFSYLRKFSLLHRMQDETFLHWPIIKKNLNKNSLISKNNNNINYLKFVSNKMLALYSSWISDVNQHIVMQNLKFNKNISEINLHNCLRIVPKW